jgi:mannose-6-phosphate isomerase-like protein (cupin superfamily)
MMNNLSQRIEKPWGYEELIEVNDKYVVKKLFMRKGHQCSLQYHQQKKETIVILEGSLTILKNREKYFLNPLDEMTIHPNEVHRMIAENDNCLYLECSTPELDDVVRIEDQYGRN